MSVCALKFREANSFGGHPNFFSAPVKVSRNDTSRDNSSAVAFATLRVLRNLFSIRSSSSGLIREPPVWYTAFFS